MSSVGRWVLTHAELEAAVANRARATPLFGSQSAQKFCPGRSRPAGRCGCNDVAEADVNLNGNLCAFEICNQGHPDAFVVGILGYAFRFDGLGIEA